MKRKNKKLLVFGGLGILTVLIFATVYFGLLQNSIIFSGVERNLLTYAGRTRTSAVMNYSITWKVGTGKTCPVNTTINFNGKPVGWSNYSNYTYLLLKNGTFYDFSHQKEDFVVNSSMTMKYLRVYPIETTSCLRIKAEIGNAVQNGTPILVQNVSNSSVVVSSNNSLNNASGTSLTLGNNSVSVNNNSVETTQALSGEKACWIVQGSYVNDTCTVEAQSDADNFNRIVPGSSVNIVVQESPSWWDKLVNLLFGWAKK
jgi:hypothetical protein